MTTRLSPELDHLGDALESAIRLQLARTAPAPTPVAVRRTRGRRAALVAAACLGTLAAGVGVAAASGVWDREDVAAGLSMSDVELAGSAARCAPVTGTTDTFDCTLLRPEDAKDLPSDDVRGWNVVLNDDEGFVAGGCRSLDADGSSWRCFVGEKSVDEKIIGPDFLGEYAPGPGVG